jgi:hypothetical protein
MTKILSTILHYYGLSADDGMLSDSARFLAMWLAEQVRLPLARA